MQKLGDKLAAIGVVQPALRTTFADGRMSTTEAFVYYRMKCQARGLPVISKMMFKWHLKQGQYLRSELVPNLFGSYPAKIYAIRPDDILMFIDELIQRENQLALQRQGAVIRRTTVAKIAEPEPEEEPEEEPEQFESEEPESEEVPVTLLAQHADSSNHDLLNVGQAHEYLLSKANCRQPLPRAIFNLYLAYELIDSKFVGKARAVDRVSMDAFLELCPSGHYSHHLWFETKDKLGPDDLIMDRAYAYYQRLDPTPINLGTFRTLAYAGIIVPIRLKNTHSSRVIGFAKTEIRFFAEMRKRVLQKNQDTPSGRAFLSKKANETRDPDQPTQVRKRVPRVAQVRVRDSVREQKIEETPVVVTGREWVTVKEAYRYYTERVDAPLGESWFRQKCYDGEIFESKEEEDLRPFNPTGKIFWVNLDSVDRFLNSNPATQGDKLSFPLDKAYFKFLDRMPPGISLIRFKRLIRDNHISSYTRDGVTRVRQGDVDEYFAVEKLLVEKFHPDSEVKTDAGTDANVVVVSMSKFPTQEELSAAITALKKQGLRVEIEP